MPTRPDMKKALGREAVYGDQPLPSAPAPAPAPKKVERRRAGRPLRTDGQRWEETHSRATFHLPLELQSAIDTEAARSGRTKSGVVADALRQHLGIR